MAVRIAVSPDVLEWAAEQAAVTPDKLYKKFSNWDNWVSGQQNPTLKQLEDLAKLAGVPFGYLLLPDPPTFELPIQDFREGFLGEIDEPSADLRAVLEQSVRRQDWYRDYAQIHDLPAVAIVGSGRDLQPRVAAADIRQKLDFEVVNRSGNWSESRTHLLHAFEDFGGLTVATSMVENNTHRMLDSDEFRGFSLVDKDAPLVFVNTNQTLNGRLFTLAHEFAHVWRGVSGISLEDLRFEPQSEIEIWCNAVASEVLVPYDDLTNRYFDVRNLSIAAQLDELSRVYRCGTLVVLQAIRRCGLREFQDFDAEYRAELERLRQLASDDGGGGGSFYRSQPFRIGERLSRAIIRDSLEGRTSLSEAIGLMSLNSLSNFDNYAKHLELV